MSLSFLQDKLRLYFSDEENDRVCIEEWKGELLWLPKDRELARQSLYFALNDRSLSCLNLVRTYANRLAEGSEEHARQWLSHLNQALFP